MGTLRSPRNISPSPILYRAEELSLLYLFSLDEPLCASLSRARIALSGARARYDALRLTAF